MIDNSIDHLATDHRARINKPYTELLANMIVAAGDLYLYQSGYGRALIISKRFVPPADYKAAVITSLLTFNYLTENAAWINAVGTFQSATKMFVMCLCLTQKTAEDAYGYFYPAEEEAAVAEDAPEDDEHIGEEEYPPELELII